MVYAISDIHGCYDKYMEMLAKINFSSEDTLYILGDVVDRGPDGIKVILDMCDRDNVVFLRGNHDHTAMNILRCLFDASVSFCEEELIPMIQLWVSDGGNTTLEQFIHLSSNDKFKVLKYLKNSITYKEIEIDGKRFLLSHTVPEYERIMEFEECNLEDFILGEPDYEIEYFPDKYLVTGHTPTGLIYKHYEGRVYMENHHIAIDCGAVFGGPLGCICLDDMKEFIRPCLRCCYCLDHGRRKGQFQNKELAIVKETTFDGGCAVNPFSHQGCVKLRFPEPKASRTVAVVGGGVAGMNAALAAADRGHKVTLYEAGNKLGGQATITDGMWFKKEQKAYHEWLSLQVNKHPNIDLKLSHRATPELISKLDPDYAIIAVGGKYKNPDIPGAKHGKSYFGAFHNHERFGKKVVVVGSGVGSEAAVYLSEDGHEVTLIDREPFIAPNIDLTVRVSLLAALEKNNVVQLPETEAIEIKPNEIVVKNSKKGTYSIEADSIILATGTEPLYSVRDSFADVAMRVISVGDAMGDGVMSIAHAVETGFDAGYTIL